MFFTSLHSFLGFLYILWLDTPEQSNIIQNDTNLHGTNYDYLWKTFHEAWNTCQEYCSEKHEL